MRREITGFSNPLVKQVRSLREKKHRKRERKFLAEGLRIMTEAREAGFLPEMLFRVKDRDVHSLEIVLEEAVLAAKKHEQELLLRAQELPNESFAEEHFFKVWDEYIHLLHEQGERIFASVLNSKRPELQQNQIRFTCTNKIMKAELEKVRPKALQYLREKLNNYSLEFDIAITEEETSKLVYTNQEKYEYLREKNEAIAYLRKIFKLDL